MLLQLPDLLISDIQMVLFYLWCEEMDTETEGYVLKNNINNQIRSIYLKQVLEMNFIVFRIIFHFFPQPIRWPVTCTCTLPPAMELLHVHTVFWCLLVQNQPLTFADLLPLVEKIENLHILRCLLCFQL